MSLVLRVTQPPPNPSSDTAKPLPKQDHLYTVTFAHNGTSASFAPVGGGLGASVNVAPSPRASISFPATRGATGPEYTVPCAGHISEVTEDEEEKKANCVQGLSATLKKIGELAAKRHSVFVINRGSSSTRSHVFFEKLVSDVVAAITPAADRALQLVADELAKEKQMERLMRSADAPTMPEAPSGTAPSKTPCTPQNCTPGATPQPPGEDGKKPAVPLLDIAAFQAAATTNNKTWRSLASMTSSPKSRFLIFTGAFTEPLLPPTKENLLTSRRFVAHPPPDRSATARKEKSSASPQHTNPRSRQAVDQLQRRASIRHLQSILDHQDGDDAPFLKNNGWARPLPYIFFNGAQSYLQLPGVPGFESILKQFSFDFWMMTASKIFAGKQTILQVCEGHSPDIGMQFHLGLNWYGEATECLRLFIRDTTNKVFEAVIPLTDPRLTAGDTFHHYLFNMNNLADGALEVLINGKASDRIKILQSEHPATFNAWASRINVGGFLDESDNILHPFRGSIMELRFSKPDAQGIRVPIVRWPLIPDPARGEQQQLTEATKSIEDGNVAVLRMLEVRSCDPPMCSPVFDGKQTIVSLGNLGPVGMFLHHFSVEMRFRTNITSRCMSLIGITDSQQKQLEMGIILNAEPTLTQERYKYRELNITFLLTDMSGRVLSAIARGTERHNVMDGNWHTISWKVVDAETNKLEVRIDGAFQDVLITIKDGPRTFGPLRDWVAVGAHNIRSWKIKNVFQGQIKSFALGVRGESIVQLNFDDGPGAVLAYDSTKHGLHATYRSAITGQAMKHSMIWTESSEVQPAAAEASPGGPTEDESGAEGVLIHRNNRVKYAVLCVDVVPVGGKMAEILTDVLHESIPVEIEQIRPLTCKRIPAAEKEEAVWASIPSTCFVDVESILAMKDEVLSVLRKQLAARENPGHLLYVCAIGDCMVSLLDLHGPILSSAASYNANMMRWQAPVCTCGVDKRRTAALNNVIAALEKCLVDVSSSPNITRRLGPVAVGPSYYAENLIQVLDAHGLPSLSARLLHGMLLNPYLGIAFWTVHSISTTPSEDDSAAVAVFQNALHKTATPRAATLIQRNWRGLCARVRVKKLFEEREQRLREVEEIREMRRTDPRLLPKQTMHALIISCLEYDGTSVHSIPAGDVNAVAQAFEKQGYTVTRIANPSKQQILAALQSRESNSLNFVYIVGYGGRIRLRNPDHSAFERLEWISFESASRQDVVSAEASEFRVVRAEYVAEHSRLKAEKQPKAVVQKPGSRGRRAPVTRQAAVLPTAQASDETGRFLEELQRHETEVRAVQIARECDAELSAIVAEFKSVMQATVDFCERWASSATPPLLVTHELTSIEPTPEAIVTLDDIAQIVLQKPKAPLGTQTVLAVDLHPLGCSDAGWCYLGCSTGHEFSIPLKPSQRGVLSWSLCKALLGHAPTLPAKGADVLLSSHVDCGPNERDWRSFAHYVVSKVLRDVDHPNPQKELSKLCADVPYVGDVVPLRKIIATPELREKQRKDGELRRVGGSVHLAIATSSVTLDLSTDLRGLLPDLVIADVIPLPQLLLTLRDGNRNVDALRLQQIHFEATSAAVHGVCVECTLSERGIEISCSSPDRTKLNQSLSSIANKAPFWRFPLRPCSVAAVHGTFTQAVEVVGVEALYMARGTTTFRKWKRTQRLRNVHPNLSNTVRILDCVME